MTGIYTPGLPLIGAISNNGTAQVAPQGQYTNLTESALIPVDSNIAAGGGPESVAATPFQLAAIAGALITNTATSTVHTATLNTVQGQMVTESLTTAAGADYTFQLVNSLITATGAIPQVQMHSGTNTQGGIAIKSITNATGTATCVFTNTGTAAYNGTMLIQFHT